MEILVRTLNLNFGWFSENFNTPGPIADPIIRKAYVAAYDRRLRHPAWVRAFVFICRFGECLFLADR